MEVIPLDPARKRQAASVYARAFLDYPQFTCYHPSRNWRTRHLSAYCELGLNFALHYGEVYTTPDLKGVIAWFLPGKTHFSIWMYLKTPGMFPRAAFFGLHNYSRVTACENYSSKVHAEIINEPHWYLWGLAVDPDCQGQGVGTRLMEPGMAKADQEGLPIYLETHAEQNILYYEKRGFELVRSERVPGGRSRLPGAGCRDPADGTGHGKG